MCRCEWNGKCAEHTIRQAILQWIPIDLASFLEILQTIELSAVAFREDMEFLSASNLVHLISSQR